MRYLIFCMLVLTITSCQRYAVISTHNGVDVHVQGNHIELVDSANHYQSYFVRGAYKNYIQNHDLNSLLAHTNAPKITPLETHTHEFYSTSSHLPTYFPFR